MTPVPPDRPVPAGAPPLFVDEPFPPYRFVPGVTPHPFAHADGWGYGSERPAPPHHGPSDWATNTAFLRGCDYFNRGWWWEAHETWEELWHAAEDHDDAMRPLLQGLIQLAACALNRERGVDRGAERLLVSAAEYLDAARARADAGVVAGLDLEALIRDARQLLAAPIPCVEGLFLVPHDDPARRQPR